MHKLGQAKESEIILAFLRAEIASPSYRQLYEMHFPRHVSRSALIDDADLLDEIQNDLRRQLLSKVRGYPDCYLFSGFPIDVCWRRVRVEPKEYGILFYASCEPWIGLSRGTRRVLDGASNINSISAGSANAKIRAVTQALIAGQRYPELIAVEGNPPTIILVEGHTRATAVICSQLNLPMELFVGSSQSMRSWQFY